MKDEVLITSAEARAILGVATLTRLINSRQLEVADVWGKAGGYLFRRADVEALRDQRARRKQAKQTKS